MKTVIRVVQVCVGVLFIISGLVKANDPLGLSYKMQEFFELWGSSLSTGHLFFKTPFINFFDFLHDHSLSLSIIMITLEICAGVALLTGWRKKFITWLLLLLIIFFGFLTGYAYMSGKFTNCGCFGDCFPITPLTSFIKDLILFILIGILFLNRNLLFSVGDKRILSSLLILSLLFSIGLQLYTLNFLPLADCLPFKVGNNIKAQMKPPPNAIQDSFAIKFIYEKNGKRFEFSPDNLPADFTTYTFIDREQKLVRKGNAEPAIKGFTLTGISGEDSLNSIMEEPVTVLLFIQSYSNGTWIDQWKKIISDAERKQVPIYVVTSNAADVREQLGREGIHIPVFACDFTILRTAARTDPAVYIIRSGTIIGKYGKHNLDKADEALVKL